MEIAASAPGAAPIGAGPHVTASIHFTEEAQNIITYGFQYSAVEFSGNSSRQIKQLRSLPKRLLAVSAGPIMGVEK
ncbi:hypothetical protein KFE96_06645 [Kordiimonas sp. SCSIO 12603]|uniref:hypothetical protein n=1 Tax=Kordiimonas sp. SCSIO 12603 TaxID=2829596 RepID=UPI0021037FCF|nr:hypothetical protein [Kordiimonas sp. SCSIO 12603]UTW59979.1 hypothetical protein KFE96_06645 [Kordiimonas sp. SCSIO 12603]